MITFRVIASAICALSVSACQYTGSSSISGAAVDPVPIQLLGKRITPDTAMRAARIYRSVEPITAIAPGTRFKEICQNDFSETSALKSIDSLVTKYPVEIRKAEFKDHFSTSGSLDGLKIGAVGIGASGEVSGTLDHVVTDVTKEELSDTGVDTIRMAISPDCRKLIANWRRSGHLVYITEMARRAREIDVTANVQTGLSASARVLEKFGFKASYADGASTRVQMENAVFEINDADPIAPVAGY
jgi:hypothetical protein